MGWGDPLIFIECGNAKIATKPLKDTKEPKWNKEVFIPINLPSVNKKLKLKLYDWERTSSNELICTVDFDLN